MVRTPRRRKVRKTIECFRRCLNRKTCPLVLKWFDKTKKIFSILYKHKKSPQWSANYLQLFKELDNLSITKCEKYKNEPDSDQACKRRCKANLRKLCEDGLLEFIYINQIDKCTKEIYYKFIDTPNNDQANFHTGDTWIDASLISDDIFTNFCSNETEQATSYAYENGNTDEVNLLQSSNASAEFTDKKDDILNITSPINNFYDNNLQNEFNSSSINVDSMLDTEETEDVNFDSILNNSSSNLDLMFGHEENKDLHDLMEMVEEGSEPLWGIGCTPNLNSEMNIDEVVDNL